MVNCSGDGCVCGQARMARVWAKHCPDRLKGLLEALQQLITLKVITGMAASRFDRDYCLQDEDSITNPTKLMKVNTLSLAVLLHQLTGKIFEPFRSVSYLSVQFA